MLFVGGTCATIVCYAYPKATRSLRTLCILSFELLLSPNWRVLHLPDASTAKEERLGAFLHRSNQLGLRERSATTQVSICDEAEVSHPTIIIFCFILLPPRNMRPRARQVPACSTALKDGHFITRMFWKTLNYSSASTNTWVFYNTRNSKWTLYSTWINVRRLRFARCSVKFLLTYSLTLLCSSWTAPLMNDNNMNS